jgi:hypothetical protein
MSIFLQQQDLIISWGLAADRQDRIKRFGETANLRGDARQGRGGWEGSLTFNAPICSKGIQPKDMTAIA